VVKLDKLEIEQRESQKEIKNDDILEEPLVNHTINIGENLHNRINKHLHLLRHLNSHTITKQKWVEEAANEKLEMEQKLGSASIPCDRYLHFKANKKLNEKIEKRVKVIKQFRKSFSKKLWLVEAIYEKLDRDDLEVKKLLEEKINHSSQLN
jgi:hypothetical protein